MYILSSITTSDKYLESKNWKFYQYGWTYNTETRLFRVLMRTVINPVKTRCSHLNTEGKNTDKPGTETGFFPFPPNSVDTLKAIHLCPLYHVCIYAPWTISRLMYNKMSNFLYFPEGMDFRPSIVFWHLLSTNLELNALKMGISFKVQAMHV